MIRSYQQITGKYLKANLRRTIMTIIGIVLSVALISSIGFFLNGIQKAQVENMKGRYGSFHLRFSEPDADLIFKIKNNPKVVRSGLVTKGEEIHVAGDLYLSKYITSGQAMELLPFKLSQGRLPEAPNEVAIERWVRSSIYENINVGDQILLQGNKYTLVGLMEDSIQNQKNQKGIMLTKNDTYQDDSSKLLVEISPKANMGKALDELKQLSKEDLVMENGYVLLMLGQGDAAEANKNTYTVVYIIIAIVIIATVAVIYNSFHISVVERVKQFGLLRTIGCTPKQARKLVFREATFLAIISIPLGLLLGMVAIYGINIAFQFLVENSTSVFQTVISQQAILISIGLGLLSIYASAFLPALYAGRISPLVAISSRALITKEKIKRRKNNIIGKLFGFEGQLAIKNIKRNPKRYRITIFSIVISVVLYITFSSFLDMSLNISEDLNESDKAHFTIYRRNPNLGDPITTNLTEKIKSIDTVQKVYNIYKPEHFSVLLNKKSEIAQIQDINGIYSTIPWNGADHTLMDGYIAAYDIASLEASRSYVESGKIDIERLNEENGVIIINKNLVRNPETEKTYVGPIATVEVGDEIKLHFNKDPNSEDEPKFEKELVKTVKVLAVLKDNPFYFGSSQRGLKIITTEEVAKRLMEVGTIEPNQLQIVMDDAKNEAKTQEAIKTVIQQNSSLVLINMIDSGRKMKSVVLMIKILLYGFVVVVSCIGCVNIVNTITTNIIIRKREFATIKSIGLTQKGLKKMIVLEGLLYGIKGSIYGSLIACGLSYLLYQAMSNIREQLWIIPWSSICIAIVASLAIGYISVLSPLARLKKDNLIDTVREDF